MQQMIESNNCDPQRAAEQELDAFLLPKSDAQQSDDSYQFSGSAAEECKNTPEVQMEESKIVAEETKSTLVVTSAPQNQGTPTNPDDDDFAAAFLAAMDTAPAVFETNSQPELPNMFLPPVPGSAPVNPFSSLIQAPPPPLEVNISPIIPKYEAPAAQSRIIQITIPEEQEERKRRPGMIMTT